MAWFLYIYIMFYHNNYHCKYGRTVYACIIRARYRVIMIIITLYIVIIKWDVCVWRRIRNIRTRSFLWPRSHNVIMYRGGGGGGGSQMRSDFLYRRRPPVRSRVCVRAFLLLRRSGFFHRSGIFSPFFLLSIFTSVQCKRNESIVISGGTRARTHATDNMTYIVMFIII